METSRRQEINRIANQIRTALELTTVPFDVQAAVSRLGGKIEESSGLESGEALVKKQGDSFVVVVQDQPENRKRFSIAHELGHLFLHMGYILDPTRWKKIDEYRDSPKYRYGFSEEEYEAHEFAAALLMPAEDFRSVARRYTASGRTALEPLAKHFQVSTHAARVRGQWLGIFEWAQ